MESEEKQTKVDFMRKYGAQNSRNFAGRTRLRVCISKRQRRWKKDGGGYVRGEIKVGKAGRTGNNMVEPLPKIMKLLLRNCDQRMSGSTMHMGRPSHGHHIIHYESFLDSSTRRNVIIIHPRILVRAPQLLQSPVLHTSDQMLWLARF
jgi:hypothetical protein